MATQTSWKQNIPHIKQHLSAILGNSSVVVKTLCISVFIGYLLSFSSGAQDVLTVIPGNVIPPSFWYWTYVTHTFLEQHFWNVLIDVVVVLLYGKLLEPLWGAKEMLIYYIFVTVSVAVSSTFLYFVVFLVARNPVYLFEVQICGLAGYVGAFSVAVKQVMPDLVLVNSPFGKLRNKHIPLWLLLLAFIARFAGIEDGPYPVMFGMGIFTSWIYLRFYQKHSNGNRGDFAESFSFASFFPDRIQPFISVLSNSIFSLMVKVKICKKPQRKYDFSAPTTITVSLPGTDPQDAERRRTLALKALNERLSKVQQSEGVSDSEWPSLEQEESVAAQAELTKGTLSIDASQQPARTHGKTAETPVDKPDTKANIVGESNNDTANQQSDAS